MIHQVLSPVKDNWTLWFHSRNSHDWLITGYERIGTFDCFRDFVKHQTSVDGWFFLMRGNKLPFCEHYTYQIEIETDDSKTDREIWYKLCQNILNETLTSEYHHHWRELSEKIFQETGVHIDSIDQIAGVSYMSDLSSTRPKLKILI